MQTLEEAIMESADYSGSSQICQKCTQGDLEGWLMPILKSLIKLRRNKTVNEAREELAKFLKDDQVIKERVFEERVSKAARTLYSMAVAAGAGNKHSEEVYKFLKKNLGPIADVLERAMSPRVRRLGKKLRRTYEHRYSPLTKKEAAESRLAMLQMGMIPYKKMTKAEKAEYDRQRADEFRENQRRRREAERTLGIHRSVWDPGNW